jgi:hypothetical protein
VKAINRELWDEKRQAYADSLHDDGTLSSVSSLLTNSAMVYFDVVPESRHDLLFGKILRSDKSLLPVGSPFGLIYVLEALDKEEKVEELFALIRKRWGEMAASGDNTVWEMFGEYGHGGFPTRSRCHTYAAFVAKYFVKYLLGLRVDKPGLKEFSVKPMPPKGIMECHGVVPTSAGYIRIGWKRSADGQIIPHVEHPRSSKCKIMNGIET